MMRKCALLIVWCGPALAALIQFGPETLVKAGGADIVVSGYSVPSYADWNNDGAPDLIIGEGSGGLTPKVRVYLNTGSAAAPAFSNYFFAQADGMDLTAPGSGCMGIFPRTVQWDGDTNKDLLAGQADGTIKVYRNVRDDAAPSFDAGAFLQIGAAGAKTTVDVGDRAAVTLVDWNNDGRLDLLIGSLAGQVHILLNQSTNAEPDFISDILVQDNGGALSVSSGRASPVVFDADFDGKKDLVVGNTEGQILCYTNVASDAAPAFAGAVALLSEGAPIDLAGTPRSRPFVCDWNGDAFPDLLVGAGDGEVHLFLGLPEPAPLLVVLLLALTRAARLRLQGRA